MYCWGKLLNRGIYMENIYLYVNNIEKVKNFNLAWVGKNIYGLRCRVIG
jgi:hypothetical protein